MSDDFAQARAALAATLGTAGPILKALERADSVFGVLANAEKHKRVLETEVADYKAELDKLKIAMSQQRQKLQDVGAKISVAQATLLSVAPPGDTTYAANSTDSQIKNTSPAFVNIGGTTTADYKLQSGSYAKDSGVTAKVRMDALTFLRVGAI